MSESENSPIFRPIDDFGPSLEKNIELVTDVGAVFSDLGVHSSLTAEIVQSAKTLQPLLSLIYARSLTSEDKFKAEGRGVYHEGIPIEDKSATVYVKGIGNVGATKATLGEEDFPGYPTNAQDLMFDDLVALSSHPRIVGTETLAWGNLEFINAAVIFAELAKQQGWTHLSQALDAGVTIPLGLNHFKGLSERMKSLLEEKIAGTSSQWEKQFLSWQGNFRGLGAVGEIVPSDERILDDQSMPQNTLEKLTDPALATITGRTLRRLLEMGIVYSLESSHGQNLYNKGFVAQADSSDLVFLGDYVSKDFVDRKGEMIHLQADEQRAALIYGQLMPYDCLTPLAFPFMAQGIRFAEVEKAQKAFWEQFLGGVAHEKAVEKLPKLMPLFRVQIATAVALLAEKSLSDGWEDTASKRKATLKKYDRFGSEEELEGKIKSNLPNGVVLNFRKTIDEKDLLGVRSMLKFLESGDESILSQNAKLKPLLDVADAIFAIDDISIRDELLEGLGRMQLMRDYSDIFSDKPQVSYDTIDMFNNKHLLLITEKIHSGNYDDAKKVMEIILMGSQWDRLMINLITQQYDRLAYATEVLDGDIPELYEQAKYHDALDRFVKYTDKGILGGFLSDDDSLDINKFAFDHNKGNPRDIFFSILDHYKTNPEIRSRVIAFIDQYEKDLIELQAITDETVRNTLLESLQTQIVSITDIPELVFAHKLIMSVLYGDRDKDKAKEYLDQAVTYYETDYPQREEAAGIDLSNLGEIHRRQKVERLRLKKMYRDLGFEKVAAWYSSREDPATAEEAEVILGEDFLGVKAISLMESALHEAGKDFHFELENLPAMPSIRELEIAHEQGEILVLRPEYVQEGGNYAFSINLRELILLFNMPPIHGNKDSYFRDKDPDVRHAFVTKENLKLEWAFVKKDLLEGSKDKNWNEQEDVLRDYAGELAEAQRADRSSVRRRAAVEVVWDTLLYYFYNRKSLLPLDGDRTSSQTLGGKHVVVGFFDEKGLSISGPEDRRFENVGICSSR